MRVSTKYDVRGIEPKDDTAWIVAPDTVRREFWRVVVKLVRDANEFERARGRDRHGRQLAHITRYTMAHRKSEMGPADPYTPALTPADALSRTVAYFDGRAYPDHAEFFWRNGWGKILDYHRRGAWNHWAKRHLPERDVIGISPAALRKVERQALAWWETRRRAFAQPPAPPQPAPQIKAPAPLPKPRPFKPAVAARPFKPQPNPVPIFMRTRKGPKRIGTLIYEKTITGPPTIGEAMTGVPLAGRRR